MKIGPSSNAVDHRVPPSFHADERQRKRQ